MTSFLADPGAITRTPDPDGRRTEITCTACGWHLGHMFKDEGFKTPTDERHRVNSISIKFASPYFVAETTMPGKYGFDLNGSSQSFNVLPDYLFGKNTANQAMEMPTPVVTRRAKSGGETMDISTPVITKRIEDQDSWKMSYVMPSKYGPNLPPPKNSAVTIKEVPGRTVAVVAFSGFDTAEDVIRRESTLRDALKNDSQFKVKSGALVEVAHVM